MTRTNRSARQAGTRFETQVVTYLAEQIGDDRIERRAKNGARDRGDVSSVRTVKGEKVVIECKNTNRLELGVWVNEAEVERGNDDAKVGMVIHKRKGHGHAGDQYVTMTVDDLLVLLGADRPEPR